MDSKKRNILIACIAGLVLLAAVAVAIWFIAAPNEDKDKGDINNITYVDPSTFINFTEPISTQPETTTLSEEESYIEHFLKEAESMSSITVEAPTTSPNGKVFFHVVTDGTVSDSNSLEGLPEEQKKIGQVILAAGFRYDKEQNIFYSESQSWQKNFGFTPIYDAGAALVGMYYDTMRLKFTYKGYDWMFQLWKGRYGITTGGEIGIYYKPEGTDTSFYACVPDDETITMSFALYHGDELYMTRGPELHWWLTGFKLFDIIAPQELAMHATFFMADNEMADLLEESLIDLGFVKNINYQRLGLTMTIIWQ